MDANTLASQLAQLGLTPHVSNTNTQVPHEGMSQSFMNLVYRNAQLETELRLVKEQLVQSHQSTQYLLGLLSGSSKADPQGDRIDNNALKFHCDTNTRGPRKDSVADVLEKAKECDPLAPLVSFEETDCLIDIDAPETAADNAKVMSQAHMPSQKLIKDTVGLGISQTNSSHSSFALTTEEATPSSNFDNPTSGQQSDFTIRQSDGTVLVVPTPQVGDSFETPPRKMQSSDPYPFSGHEHRRLAGNAFVWVDMTPDELSKAIANWAKENPRHTAEEYRTYFEDIIRPAYHERARETAKARESPVKNQGVKNQGAVQDNGESDAKSSQCGVGQGEVKSVSSPDSESSNEPPSGTQTLIDRRRPVGDTAVPEGKDDDGGEPFPQAHSKQVELPAVDPESTNEAPPSSPSVLSLRLSQTQGASLEHSDSASEAEPVPVPATGTQSTTDYQPPRLFNPTALGDAKALQADFRSRGPPSRGRRHVDRSTGSERHDSKASRYAEGGDRPGFRGTAYTAYPNTVEELFATPADGDHDSQRTVLVGNIPTSATLFEVLEAVRGGPVFSSIFVETTGMRTKPAIDTNTALVTFVRGGSARAFVKQSTRHPSSTNTFSVRLLPSTSRPIPARLLSDIRQHHLTRILFINDTGQVWTANEVALQLIHDGVRHPLQAESHAEVPGLLLFHFASIAEAETAWFVVGRDHAFFGNVERGYFADPCGTPDADPDADVEGKEEQKQAVVSVEEVEKGVEQSGDEMEDGQHEGDNNGQPEEVLPNPPRMPYRDGIHTEVAYQSIMFEG
ncbi:hypothetical protein CERZMDRAFT_84257 [Cercospora zeae-maydis SCOH1-5]|uniref:RRM domain-containing protein n=1 Tax=Cercospora zeae-maydis SCOH1-5 TaxID=717836 RepID=A0A6A6FH84_9PEZI|nr:hypothetical protein CERZMDRAFT_84257 [Cercospora zeae-maydis SCOH1-5]